MPPKIISRPARRPGIIVKNPLPVME